MIKALVTDFSRVLLHPLDPNYSGGLNSLQRELEAQGEYDFWAHFKLNQELLEFYKAVGQRIPVYIFTSEYIQDHPAVKPQLESVFTAVLSAARLGLSKKDPETYQIIAEKIGVQTADVVYTDDSLVNVTAANKGGMRAVQFETNAQIIPVIKLLLV